MSPPTPLFSIIVPTYHAARTLGRTLRSLQAQVLQSIEVLVIDGGSRDDTVAVAQRFPDVVHTLVSEKDRGQAHAINKGFALARGEYVGWLCADDELLPGTLQHAANLFAARPAVDIVSGACLRQFEDGSSQVVIPPANAFEIMGIQYRIEQPSTFWRRSCQAGLQLDESYYFAFDWDFFATLAKRAREHLIVPEVMSIYHFSPHNKTSRGGRRLMQEMYHVVERHGPLDGRLAKIFSLLYRRFDLAGCYDSPPSCRPELGARFGRLLTALEARYGRELIHLYNWNFASKQERGLVWYR